MHHTGGRLKDMGVSKNDMLAMPQIARGDPLFFVSMQV